MTQAFIDFLKYFFEYILKVLQAGAGWPAAVLIVAYWFKGEISKKISEIVELWFPGGKAKMENQQKSQTVNSEKVQAIEKQMEIERETFQSEIQRLKNEKGNTEASKNNALKMASDLFVKNNKLERDLGFEKIYNIMYGSQLYIMKEMMGLPLGLTRPWIETFYTNAQQANPHLASYPFNNYIGFLVGLGYVEYDSTRNVYRLLPAGKAFMDYVIENNYMGKLPW